MHEPIFNPEDFNALRKPLLEASTLPAHCYTEADFYQGEMDKVFLDHWQYVCREEQIAKAGDFFCHEGVGGSVIVMRADDGQIRAYANSCRHRGSRLLDGNGSCRRIVCPYHSWVYDLDGLLLRTPGMDGAVDFDAASFPLLKLPLQSWGGFVFIHYREPKQAVADYLGSFTQKFASHNPVAMRHVGSLEFDIASNWKLLAENALEAYHTGSVHRDTLGAQDAVPIDQGSNWTGLLVQDENSVATLRGENKPFAHIEGLDEEARNGAYFTLLYPSTQFVFAQDCMWWLAFQPLAVDRTRLQLGACFPEESIARPDFEEKLALYFKRWELATREDNAICEKQQQGQIFDRPAGRFAPAEFAVHAFSNWLIDQLCA